MRIAIDASYRMHGGGMVHLKRLLQGWERVGCDRQHTIYLCTREENLARLAPLGPNIKIITLPSKASQMQRFWFQNVTLRKILREHKIDVLYCPGGFTPLKPPVPTVVTFHNAAPFCSYVTLSTVGWRHWLHFKVLGLLMRVSAASASRVVFISKFFRDIFQNEFGFHPDRTDVVYHGNDGVSFARNDKLLAEKGISGPFMLCVSHLYPYKNLGALIEAYGLARQVLQEKGLKLAMVGAISNPVYYRQLLNKIETLGLKGWILLTGPVPHEGIGSLLSACEFFVFQSTCENCPMTLIEALGAGIPVASSNAGVMPEIAGDAAEYFDPCKPEEIARAMTRLAQDETRCEELKRHASARIAQFPNWDETARLTLDSIERALESR